MRRIVCGALGGVIGGLLLAGPAGANELANMWARTCNRPVAQLTLAEITYCRETQEAAQSLARLVLPDGAQNDNRSVTVYRGSVRH